MTEEFDPVALDKLIAEALAEEVRPSAAVVLSHYEGQLLETLSDILPANVRKEVMGKLREGLFPPSYATYDAFAAGVAKCHRCPGVGQQPGMTMGNTTDPDLLVVIEFLRSRDGGEVLTLLEEAGISRQRVALTGATRCPGARAKEDVDRCLNHLVTEIELLRPSLVLTVGGTATAGILGADVKVGASRGQVFWSNGYAIMCTYSPAIRIRGGRAESDLRTDMVSVRRYLDG